MSRRHALLVRLRDAWPRHAKRVLASLVASLTLGLAPFVPHAHVWKQLVNLANGTLTAPMDQFDLVLHGAPFVALAITLGAFLLDVARRAAPATTRDQGASDVAPT